MEVAPVRTVDGNLLVSTALPAIAVRVDPSLAYVDRLQFVLYDVAQVDLFLFVQAEEARAVRALMVQFEGYLPHVDATYAYPETATVVLGAHTYASDVTVIDLPALLEQHPGSEAAHVAGAVRRRGLMPAETVTAVRFARVVDAAGHHELLITYLEEVGRPDGADQALADEDARRRALASFTVLDE